MIVVFVAIGLFIDSRKIGVFRFELVAPLDRAGLEHLGANGYLNEYACFVQTGPMCSREHPFNLYMVKTALRRETEQSDFHARFASHYATSKHDARLDAVEPGFSKTFIAELRESDVLIAYTGSDDPTVVRDLLSLVVDFLNGQASAYIRGNAVPYLERLRALADLREKTFSPTIPDPALRESELDLLRDFRHALDSVSLDPQYQLIRNSGAFDSIPLRKGIVSTALVYILFALTAGITGALVGMVFRSG